jgi:hypothetical protein
MANNLRKSQGCTLFGFRAFTLLGQRETVISGRIACEWAGAYRPHSFAGVRKLKPTPQPLRDSEENGLELKAVSQFEIASDKRISQHLSGWTIAIVSAHFALTHEFS